MTDKDLKDGICILKIDGDVTDKLTYISTTSSANQPIYLFKNKYNKDVTLNKFELRNYFVVS